MKKQILLPILLLSIPVVSFYMKTTAQAETKPVKNVYGDLSTLNKETKANIDKNIDSIITIIKDEMTKVEAELKALENKETKVGIMKANAIAEMKEAPKREQLLDLKKQLDALEKRKLELKK